MTSHEGVPTEVLKRFQATYEQAVKEWTRSRDTHIEGFERAVRWLATSESQLGEVRGGALPALPCL